MITVELVGDRELMARLEAMPRHVHDGLARAVTRLGLELQRKIQSEKLSGQVLGVRSGALRSSINTEVADSATEISATVGTGSCYAAAHEFGFDGTVGVRAHLRRITAAFGHPIRPTTVSVRAHSRHMHLPERSFLRSALAEMAPAIEAELRAAMAESLART
jgi:phage gpG-like protein